MRSQNFEFLRAKRTVLADLAGFAERYTHEDPASSLIKQRSFVEHVVTAIYERYRLLPPLSDNLNDLMNAESFRQSVPEVVQNKLHTVRKAGNYAAHPFASTMPMRPWPTQERRSRSHNCSSSGLRKFGARLSLMPEKEKY